MKNLLIACSVLVALLMGISVSAQLTGVVMEEIAFFEEDYTDGGALIPAGSRTYRIYAELEDPTDFVLSVFAYADCFPLHISTTTTFTNQQFTDGNLGSGINAAILAIFPGVFYDSYVTIGAETSQGGDVNEVWADPENALDNSFSANSEGLSFQAEDGVWFVVPEAPNGFPDGNGQVLLAQLTTTGEVTYQLNLQILDDGDNENTLYYVGNLVDCDFLPGIAGTDLGLLFPNLFCTDPLACNYTPDPDPELVDNSICDFESCYGCMDDAFCNYDPDATFDDGSCTDTCPGCVDDTAENYDPNANQDDGSCIYSGCTNPDADNYNPDASIEDGSCVISGCTDPEAMNFIVYASVDDESCQYTCTDNFVVVEMADDFGTGWYNASSVYEIRNENNELITATSLFYAHYGDQSHSGANVHCLPNGTYTFSSTNVILPEYASWTIACVDNAPISGSPGDNPITFTVSGNTCIPGCMNQEAENYDPEATFNVGCDLPGCIDSNADNFDPSATVDDGSCLYEFDGYVFNDVNTDGTMNPGEIGLANQTVTHVQTNTQILTDAEGYFNFGELTPGNHTFALSPVVDYPLFTTPDLLQTIGQAQNDLLFGVSDQDPELSMDLDFVMPLPNGIPCNGSTVSHFLTVENTGNTTADVHVEVYFDPLFTEFLYEVNPWQPDSISGDTLYFSFQDVAPNAVLFTYFMNYSPGPGSIGEWMASGVNVTMYHGGVLMADETVELTYEVTCAYDPNDKQVFPAGYTEEDHFILNETPLTYQVRFQNVGNAPATDVLIRDTISPYLDLESFHVLENSHDMEASVDPITREVTFLFENIMLPDTAADMEGSHGFVLYNIDPYSELEEGARIENTAHIFFDDNPAVVTNTTWNTIFVCDQLATMEVSDYELCPDELINLTSLSDHVEVYNWLVDEEVVGNEAMLEWSSNTPGEYLIGLQALNPLCNVTNTFPLTVHPAPVAEITEIDGELWATEGESYQWLLNGAVIENATNINWTPLEPGTYGVVVFNEFGCWTESDAIIVVGVAYAEEDAFSFYPNPVTDVAKLVFEQPATRTIQVVALTGQTVWSTRTAQSTLTLDASKWAPGTYTLVITNANGTTQTTRIVVE